MIKILKNVDEIIEDIGYALNECSLGDMQPLYKILEWWKNAN